MWILCKSNVRRGVTISISPFFVYDVMVRVMAFYKGSQEISWYGLSIVEATAVGRALRLSGIKNH